MQEHENKKVWEDIVCGRRLKMIKITKKRSGVESFIKSYISEFSLNLIRDNVSSFLKFNLMVYEENN